ncbi:hypothetical protein MPRF_06270 [Mycolicibacterium parafortuitum]|uniref:VWFA domain-containing protein n=1 Tax=Mycolicibacterium parafortuitum TaxID=39692 RepID=A0A7I7TX79_MYCPF|nr:hypothetical protein [Mycolicibacterium parafortuitum]BBY73728.1 hypothetical protein MPRF_06270 [Mycolicibacterium parafortuitum]
MDLRWWAVAAAGLGAVVLAVALAMLLPAGGRQDRQLPLANTARLTRLPEYRAVIRRQTRAAVAALALLIALCAVAAVTSARPTTTQRDAGAAAQREDIMLCVGEPADAPPVSEFLGYFARQATAYGTERIALTSPNRRLIPMTRDYQFAAGRLAEFARNAPTAPPFTAGVEYADYTPTVADVLALCLTGFPGFETPGDTHRTLIYLGPGALRDPDDTGPSLYTDAAVADMARQAGVVINAIATPGRDTGALSAAVDATGGEFFRFEPDGLGGELDAIRARSAEQRENVDARIDAPGPELVVALALSALLGVGMLAVRR